MERILVVDDEADCQTVLAMYLESQGYRVQCATSAIEALSIFENDPPDLVISDVMMPEMDGFEFLDQMRRRPEWREIPVLVATAKDLTAEDRQRLSSGVDRIIQKHASERDTILQEVGRTLAAYVKRADANVGNKIGNAT